MGHHPQPVSTPFREPRELGYRGLRRGPRRVVQGAGQVGLAARAVRRHLPALADPNASSERRPGSALSARAALNPLLAAAAALSAREPGRPLPPPRAAPDALTLCALETPAPRPPPRLQLLLPRDRDQQVGQPRGLSPVLGRQIPRNTKENKLPLWRRWAGKLFA